MSPFNFEIKLLLVSEHNSLGLTILLLINMIQYKKWKFQKYLPVSNDCVRKMHIAIVKSIGLIDINNFVKN